MAIDFHNDPRGIELQLLIERSKYERWITGEMDQILRDAFKRITTALLSADVNGLSTFERSRLLRLYSEIERLLGDAYGSLTTDLTAEMQQYAVLEADIARAHVAVAVNMAGIQSPPLTGALDGVLAQTLVRSIATFPIRGLAIGDWFEGQATKMTFETKRTIQQGLIDGLSTSKIARMIVPSTTGADPAVQRIALRDMKSVVRTTQTAVGNYASIQSYVAAGPNVSDRYRWTSVRDSRTTPICRALDGKVFRYSDPTAPTPPAHVGCRSRIKALLAAALARALGVDPAQPSYKWDDYGAWLKDQNKSTQDDTLGATRANWWRDGRMTLEQAVDDDGRTLTIAELRTRLGIGAPSLVVH